MNLRLSMVSAELARTPGLPPYLCQSVSGSALAEHARTALFCQREPYQSFKDGYRFIAVVAEILSAIRERYAPLRFIL